MDGAIEIHKLSELCSLYAEVVNKYLQGEIIQTRDPADKENTIRDDWHDGHYLSVGYSAMHIIVKALLANLRRPPRSVLDFPCGSGRVTRHLRAMFPDANIGACDLYGNHVDFCAAHFAATPFISRENLDELDLGAEWDLVFCGSLLSHLPEKRFWPTIRFIARSLSPTGIAIVTLEGRHAEYIQDNKWKFLADELFDRARAPFHEDGFGFVDYAVDFRQQKFPDQEQYGIALTKPSWLMKGLESIYSIKILSFTEREWDDHQDVLVFGRPGVND